MTIDITALQPHAVIRCDERHYHVVALSTLRRWAAGKLPYENLVPCLVRAICSQWLKGEGLGERD